MKLIYYRHNNHTKMDKLPQVVTNYNELTLVNSGELEYTIDGKTNFLRAGDVLYVTEGKSLSRNKIQDTDYISFNFISEIGDETFDFPLVTKDVFTNEIHLIISACDEIVAKNDKYSEQVCLLCQCILKQLQINLIHKKYTPITLQIIDYINANLDKNITLKNISEITFFSATYCSRTFRNDTGKSIMEYFIEKRIEKIKNLIAQGEQLKSIADKLGFGSYSYMSRLFTSHEGYSPIKFKQQVLAKTHTNNRAYTPK